MKEHLQAVASPHTDLNHADASYPRQRAVGQLEVPEQLVLWALRRRQADGCAASARLVAGFRLVFGIGWLEAALAAFERLYEELEPMRRNVGPVTRPEVSSDEEGLLCQAGVASNLDEPAELSGPARAFVRLVRRAGLAQEQRKPGAAPRLH